MIRLVHLLKRNPNMSANEFNRWLRDEHGPLVAYHQATLRIVRYVQTHRNESTLPLEQQTSEARGGIQPPYDALAETWWDSEQDIESILGSKAYGEILAHEQLGVDQRSSPLWFADEYPQVATQPQRVVASSKSGIVKIHFAINHVPTMSLAEGQRYWLTRHGPLIRSMAPARGMAAYTQVHRVESPLSDQLRTLHGSEAEPYMGHAEAWFDRSVARTGAEAVTAAARAIEDEKVFIDLPRSTCLFGKELVFVDRDWL